MATFPFSHQHDAKTLTHIYLITVSINRMLIPQLSRIAPIVVYIEFAETT